MSICFWSISVILSTCSCLQHSTHLNMCLASTAAMLALYNMWHCRPRRCHRKGRPVANVPSKRLTRDDDSDSGNMHLHSTSIATSSGASDLTWFDMSVTHVTSNAAFLACLFSVHSIGYILQLLGGIAVHIRTVCLHSCQRHMYSEFVCGPELHFATQFYTGNDSMHAPVLLLVHVCFDSACMHWCWREKLL